MAMCDVNWLVNFWLFKMTANGVYCSVAPENPNPIFSPPNNLQLCSQQDLPSFSFVSFVAFFVYFV
jgi:hypothetical protein